MSRKLTAEEKRQWRESNRFTRRNTGRELDEELEELSGADFAPDEVTLAAASGPPSPQPKNKTLPPLTPLNGREVTRLLKTYGAVEAVLDLHGLTKLDAHTRVQHFIHHQHAAGRRHLLIITGKGRTSEGVLRTNLPHWLNDAPMRCMVSAIGYAKPEKGGTGVMHVILKRKR